MALESKESRSINCPGPTGRRKVFFMSGLLQRGAYLESILFGIDCSPQDLRGYSENLLIPIQFYSWVLLHRVQSPEMISKPIEIHFW